MNITATMVKELRDKTGAGMMDAKKALVEVDGDMEKAMEVLRQKGMASADKKMGRIAAEGRVGSFVSDSCGAMIEVNCETDFVAKNADFVALTQAILDAAVANRCKTLEEVKALPMGNGTVQDAVTDRSGITGEKMELDGYMTV
ncbi:TPA: translation elongation factor Ts, partial [Candidatus Gastranaerophilales bacterium HUM_13]